MISPLLRLQSLLNICFHLEGVVEWLKALVLKTKFSCSYNKHLRDKLTSSYEWVPKGAFLFIALVFETRVKSKIRLTFQEISINHTSSKCQKLTIDGFMKLQNLRISLKTKFGRIKGLNYLFKIYKHPSSYKVSPSESITFK